MGNSGIPRYAIGDVHGRSFWKSYIKKEFKEFYFTGDYFDSFDIPFAEQYDNFSEICNAAISQNTIFLALPSPENGYCTSKNISNYLMCRI